MTPSSTSHEPDGAGRPAAAATDGSLGDAGPGDPVPVTLLLFAAAREAAGCPRCRIEAASVAQVLDEARRRFGEAFGAVLDRSRVWVNGEPVAGPEPLRPGDEVAVLPPVSGG